MKFSPFSIVSSHNDLVKIATNLKEKILRLQKFSELDIDTLTELFAKGWKLAPPVIESEKNID